MKGSGFNVFRDRIKNEFNKLMKQSEGNIMKNTYKKNTIVTSPSIRDELDTELLVDDIKQNTIVVSKPRRLKSAVANRNYI